MLEDVKQALLAHQWLHLHIQEDTARVQGSIIVPGDRFNVEILFLPDYPRSLPEVQETAARIPRIQDRHINPIDNTACVCIPDEWFLQRKDESFSTFLQGPVYNFFLSQKHFEIHKTWPFGDRRHGNDGLLDFYREQFGTQDRTTITEYIRCLSQEKIKGHWNCPCGSGKRIRNCHGDKIHALRSKVPSHIAIKTLERLLSNR
ncbi:MAG: hypothetical protein WBK55_08605 [Alphaproteobacteria bacterium]